MLQEQPQSNIVQDFTYAWNKGVAPITQHFIKKYYDYVRLDGSDANGRMQSSRPEKPRRVRRLLRYIRRQLQRLQILNNDNIILDKLLQEKQHATSYDDWLAAVVRLDEMTQKEAWKQEEETTLYDWKLVKGQTEKMRAAREQRDWLQLLYIIRTTWVRDLGNMCNVNLYRHSHVGTKYIIDEYVEESKRSLHELVYQSNLDMNYMLGMLVQTRKNIGRTALVLSGGSTFGLFHIGVLSTLFEQELLPRVISGSSAGAIVASILCVHHKHELVQLIEDVLQKEFNIFEDESQKVKHESLLMKISRFLKNGTWFDNKHLINTMIGFLGDLTFREAYNRTGKILSITVSPASVYEQPRLLNQLTAPNVLIWSAVCASCSLPGVFPSTPIYEKDPKTGETTEWNSSSVKFVDGSVDNDLPIAKLSEMFNVDHIIACQVNIHAFPFLKLSLSCVGGEVEDEFSARLKQNLSTVYNFVVNEVIHLLELGTELGIARNLFTKMRSVLSQQYSGDITILPDLKMLLRIKELLANPTQEFLLRETVNGARATWPKIAIIKNHCGQEFELDRVINYLKGKLISKPSQSHGTLHFVDNSISLINSPIIYHQDQSTIIREFLDAHKAQDGLVVDKPTKLIHAGGRYSYYGAAKSKVHFRRKSESSAEGKGFANLAQPRSASSSPFISEKVMPIVIGYHGGLRRKRSGGYLTFSAGKKSPSSSAGKSLNNYTISESQTGDDNCSIVSEPSGILGGVQHVDDEDEISPRLDLTDRGPEVSNSGGTSKLSKLPHRGFRRFRKSPASSQTSIRTVKNIPEKREQGPSDDTKG
ncbi:ADR231Cp [Eremothecium gossypii ATCC 10895]|uniref:Patatin-like phospholipase domain-containing protein n=1 Tax=Eremothecium gossypii (strain ATCC 10895 / CBS 109.51 / FGSC 9923 / NRRL Y-1056) TaxID=284811 RepID=Q759P4_EREGS|nr:ADR231Cp [Eremothecium gossypii ATCC 10895]AAS52151.2 ADR231Cp [Eremothecium gossypii ATCC 10895]AEY96450.1 FADR231Cp [Eremothecium gossypii FDAG1]